MHDLGKGRQSILLYEKGEIVREASLAQLWETTGSWLKILSASFD